MATTRSSAAPGTTSCTASDGYDRLSGGAGNDWLNAGSAAEPAVRRGRVGLQRPRLGVRRGPERPTSTSRRPRRASSCRPWPASPGPGLIDLARQIAYVGNDTYTVRLFVNGFWQDVQVWYNGDLTTDANGIYDCLFDREGEFWPLLYQRAYMLTIGYDPYSAASMATFDGEWNGNRALTTISGWASQTAPIDATMTPGGAPGLGPGRVRGEGRVRRPRVRVHRRLPVRGNLVRPDVQPVRLGRGPEPEPPPPTRRR